MKNIKSFKHLQKQTKISLLFLLFSRKQKLCFDPPLFFAWLRQMNHWKHLAYNLQSILNIYIEWKLN
jgi:hypothetical protein